MSGGQWDIIQETGHDTACAGLATLDSKDWAYRGDYDNSDQGTDPSTDLRGVGVLGLVTATYLAVTPELLPFTRDLYALSRTQDQVGGDWRAVSHVTSILTSDWSRAPSSR